MALNLSEEAIEKRRAYQREWAKRNPEKIREKARRYWERKAAKELSKNEGDEGC